MNFKEKAMNKLIMTAAALITVVGTAMAGQTYYTLSTENGNYVFTPVEPEVEPEKPPVETEPVPQDPELAKIEYCQNFDTSQGLTFEYVDWQRQCDTDRDGEYKFCKDWQYPGPINFSYVWWYRGCLDDPDFTPVE